MATPTGSSAATLTSLPRELIAQIGNYADPKTAASLAGVSRLTAGILERRIWRDLELYLTEEFMAQRSWLGYIPPEREAELRKARAEYALRKMAKGVLMNGNDKRWKMVETVTLCSRSPAMSWVVNFFENISPFIRSLAIRPTVGVIPSAESLDNHLLACHSELLRCGLGLSFSSLTTVQIGHNALYSILFIPFLCNSAPHLVSLAFEYNAVYEGAANMPQSPLGGQRFIERDTVIRKFSLSADLVEVVAFRDPAEVIVDLLNRSPNLVSLSCEVDEAEAGEPALAAATCIGRMLHLRTLHWGWLDGMVVASMRGIAVEGPNYPQLQRLILPTREWSYPVSETARC